MKTYLYPQNLKAKANLWLWSLRDFAIFAVAVLGSAAIFLHTGILLPAAVTLCFGFLTIRKDEVTVLDFLGYVMGTFGQVLTKDLLAAKLQQLPDAIGPYEDYIRANYLGVRTADCIGLIKGYSWYDPETGSITYGSNGMPDVSADQIYNVAMEKGSISTMPEIPGLIVHATGHVGIYIGDGYVIEAKGTRYGVVKTALSAGNWTGWCKNPYINYVEDWDSDIAEVGTD